MWVGRKSEVAEGLSSLTFLYSSRVWSRMGPFIHHSPMEATTSVIVPTLARIALFNSAALSSEAREREKEGEGEGGGKKEGVEEGRRKEKEGKGGRGEREGEGGGWKRGEGKGERKGEERGRAEYNKAGQPIEHCRAQAITSFSIFLFSHILQSLCAALSYLPLIGS